MHCSCLGHFGPFEPQEVRFIGSQGGPFWHSKPQNKGFIGTMNVILEAIMTYVGLILGLEMWGTP